jgi:uncharacterized membrane protein YfcA
MDVENVVKLALYVALGILSATFIFWWVRSGRDPRAAFPVMMGSGAFTGIVAGIRFLDKRCYDRRAALGLTLGGIPAVLLAAFAVKSLSLDAIRWLVVVVIVYTAVTMLRSASAERQRGKYLLAAKGNLP